jgi:hypothetical protein
MVYIGDDAWCGACKSIGVIIGGAGVTEQRRMFDLAGGGRRQAVDGDEVHCKCPTPPRIVAVHGMKWRIVDRGGDHAASPSARAAAPSSPPAEPRHERWFRVWDSTTGESLPDRDFIANVGGVRQTGRTDGDGYARIVTNGAQPVSIHVVFEAPRRRLNARGA